MAEGGTDARLRLDPWPAAMAIPVLLARRVRNLRGPKAALFAAALGALAAAAMAPFYLWPVLFLSLSGSVWLIDGTGRSARPVRSAFYRGWAFGFGYFLFGLYWVGYAFLVDVNAHAWLLPFVAILFPGGLALFFGAAFAASRALWRNGVTRAAVFSVCVSASEWLRGHVLTGFPWNLFGYTWGGSEWMIQFASIAGIYCLSLLTIVAMAAPAALVESNGPRLRPAWVPLALPLAIVIGLFVYGVLRLPDDVARSAGTIRVRIVQPNVPQGEKWKDELIGRNWRILLDLTRSAGLDGIDLVVWPEAAPPFILTDQPDALRIIGTILPRGAALLTGSVLRATVVGSKRFHNGMLAIDDNGLVQGRYEKSHLVPFGEYLPFSSVLENLGITKITGGTGGYLAGDGVKSVTLRTLRKTSTFGPLICYEIVFPGEVTEAGNRPNFLVNLTDDSWFGPSTGPYQHLGIARIRAVEEGLPIVRAANTGMSAMIDPYGRILQLLQLGAEGVVDGELPSQLPPTLYARLGDVIYAMVMVALCGLIVGVWTGLSLSWGRSPR
jgi:apolipoprotein N-acyltransferase